MKGWWETAAHRIRAALQEQGFHSITTMECRLRKYDVRSTGFEAPVFATAEEMAARFATYTAAVAARRPP